MVVIGMLLGIVILAGLVVLWAWRFTKAGPNEVLIISGRSRTIVDAEGRKRTVGYRLVRGGGTFVWPIRERVQRLTLELLTVEVRTPDAYTAQGVKLLVDGVAQIKVRGDDASIAMAAEQFLSKSPDDIKRVALQVVEGYLRAVLGTLNVEDIYLKRQEFARRVREVAAEDLSRMGLDLVSLTIRHVADEHGYLEALGKPRVAQVKRDAVIGEAEAEKVAQTYRFEAETKIAEARRDMEMKQAEFMAAVRQRQAEADLAYDLQKFKTSQAVKREEIAVQLVAKTLEIELEEKEIERQRHALAAQVEKPADAERYRIQALAEATRYQLEAQAAGEAEAIRARGFAEAEALKAKGLAEAEAMNHKAGAWKEYNEAAVTEMVVDVLPKLAGAIAQPLSKTDKIVIVGGGNGHGTGAFKVTQDVAEIIAQLPTVVESLTGVKLGQLVDRLPGLKAGEIEPGTNS